MIRLIGVSKDYLTPESGDVVHALRTVSLEIPKGEFLAVMGPSGCGKSTLLHITGGLDSASKGEVWVEENAIHQLDERSLSLFRRKSVGVIFQFFNLLPQLTTVENVSLPLRLLGVSTLEAESRAGKLLDEVGLSGKALRLPAELSGGEQQRVAIARALVHHPSLILADEPTGNLDSATSTTVLAILKDLQRTYNATMLLVTHSMEVSLAAHRTITMQDGQIVSKAA